MAESCIVPERLLELSGLTEDDIDLETLREVIKRFSVTEKGLAGATSEELATELCEILKTDYIFDYSYLLKTPLLLNSLEDLPGLKCVAAFNSLELMCETALIDLEAGTIYTSPGLTLYADIRTATKEAALTEEVGEAIIDTLERFPWDEWADRDAKGDAYLASRGLIVETEHGVFRCLDSGNKDLLDELFKTVHAILSIAYAAE